MGLDAQSWILEDRASLEDRARSTFLAMSCGEELAGKVGHPAADTYWA